MKTRSKQWVRTRCLPTVYCVGLVFLGFAAPARVHAQTLATLYNFCPSEPYCGTNPIAGLMQAANGNFYGTTQVGGVYYVNGEPYQYTGTVFEITPAGVLTTLHSFDGTDGSSPLGGLVQGSNGNFYGTTSGGGAYNFGTVFKISAGGVLTTLYSFAGTDGSDPTGGLVQGSNGDFYGTTGAGGIYDDGTVFKITAAGALTILHSFGGADGSNPLGGLVQGNNGNFYGTTNEGGTKGGYGTVFVITPAGKLTTLHSFDYSDGNGPYGGLVQATNGNFYGVTEAGGANSYGTVFEISQTRLTTLYNFCSSPSCTDGYDPQGTLLQATDGNFYGTTVGGGASGNYGTVFEITPAGALTTLHSFDSTDGSTPPSGLVQATDGNFYGTTGDGGTYDGGTVFRLSVGLGPFVDTLPTSGKVGATVYILGTNLKGASKVAFNKTAATFKVVSATEIKTSVPSGATTGFVTVTIPSGTLNSNKIFGVIPQITSFDPASGAVGTSVTVNGQSLTGATSVTFGGVKATNFTVDSYMQITVTVPSGAKTGKITVTTPGGTATSTGIFTVD